MQNWKTSLGGAVSIVGSSLFAIGVVTTQTSIPDKVTVFITVAGFIIGCIGKGLTALFAADATTVQNVAAAVDKINAQGTNPDAAPSVTKLPTPPTTPTT